MTMNTYDVGTIVRVTATFKDISGTMTDPGAVMVTISKPDGTTVTGSATKDSTGVYHYDVDTTSWQGGIIGYKFVGASPAQVVGDTTFYLRDPGF